MSRWAEHGTKYLGSAIAGIAALQLASTQVQLLLSARQYAWFQIITSVVLAVLGSLTVKRGFDNSAQPQGENVFKDNVITEKP